MKDRRRGRDSVGWLAVGLIGAAVWTVSVGDGFARGQTTAPTRSGVAEPKARRAGRAGNNRRVEKLSEQLWDPAIELAVKRRCVEWLLNEGGQRAHELVSQGIDQADPTTRQLILEGLTRFQGELPGVYLDPLKRLLMGTQEGGGQLVARALGRSNDRLLMKWLVDVATDGSAEVAHRATAATALGQHRGRSVAKVLIGLLDEKQPAQVQAAAFAALADLTGISEFGRNAAVWRRWWEEHRDIPSEQWSSELVDRFARRSEDLAGQRQRAVDRLVEVTRQLYRAANQEDRQTMLLNLLGDGLEPIRQLALDLSEQRLIDAEPIGAALREGLRQRLDDPSAQIRRGAAQFLLDLTDELAARMVARRLVSGIERSPDVMGVYLSMMARMPQAEVVDQALGWLEDPRLSSQAAGVVSAAAAVGMLDEEQWTEAVWCVRRQLAEGRPPDPKFVELLGRLGGGEDWDWVQQWIRSPEDAIKRAAAQVWADSDRPLVEFMELAGDPVIQPIAIEAARRRGYRLQTFESLVMHEPKEEQAHRAWERAVTAMAWRMEPQQVAAVDDTFRGRENWRGLRRMVLTASINRLTDRLGLDLASGQEGSTTAGTGISEQEQAALQGVLIELLSRRGRVNLTQGYPGEAAADYERIGRLGTEPATQREARMGMLEALVASGQMDRGFELFAQILNGTRSTADGSQPSATGDGRGLPNSSVKEEEDLRRAVEPFLLAATRQIEQERKTAAAELLARLRKTLGHRVAGELRLQLEGLEKRANGKVDSPQAAARAQTQPPKPSETPGSAQPPESPKAVDAGVASDGSNPADAPTVEGGSGAAKNSEAPGTTSGSADTAGPTTQRSVEAEEGRP